MNNPRNSQRYSSILGQYNDYRRSRIASQSRNSHRSSLPLRFNDYDYVIDDDIYVNNNNNDPYPEDNNYPPYDPNFPNQYPLNNLPYTSSNNHHRHHSHSHASYKHNSKPMYPYNNYNNTENYIYNENDIPEDTYNPNHRFNYPPRNNEDTVVDLTDIPIISYPSPSSSYAHNYPNYSNNPNYYYNQPIPNGFPTDEGVPMPQPNGEYRKYLYRKKEAINQF